MTNFGRTDQARAVYDSVVAIFHNAQTHRLTFIDEKTDQPYQPIPDRIAQIVWSGFPASLFVRDTSNTTFKIDIGRTLNKEFGAWQSFVSLYPLEPYKKKKGIDCQQEERDLDFYIERILELCEGFVIWELVAE